MSYELLEIATKQSVKELYIYANKEKQRRLKKGNTAPGVVPDCPTGPFYLISFSDELLIIISGSPNFFLPPPPPPPVRGFHGVTRQ